MYCTSSPDEISPQPTLNLAFESTDPQASLYLFPSLQEVEPPASDLNGYCSVDVKPEYDPSMSSENNTLSTPIGKLHLQEQIIDFGFNHVLGNSMPPSGTPFEATDPHVLQQKYLLRDSITGGSAPMAPSPPCASNLDYNEYPLWPSQMTNTHLLDCNFYNITEPSAMHIYIDSLRSNAPTSVLWSDVKRNVNKDNAQRRGTPLQKYHGSGEANKNTSETQISVSKIPKATHMCDFPECEKQTAFKRREHLQRHRNTKHGLGVEVKCDFCPKKFNRRDNWRQHLRLHAEPNRPMTRTYYYEKAVQQYEEERSNTKRRRPPVKKE